MKLIKTRDSSYTLYSDIYKEHYHSLSGAFEEASKKYVKPCRIRPGMKILDICFGLGYNSCIAIHSAKKLRIVALEKDIPNKTIQKIRIPKNLEKAYKIIREAARNLSYKDNNIHINIISGDAAETIKQIKEKFDAVFLDPFSPPKNPELWTDGFFKDIRSRMKSNAVLATYSCSNMVRNNLRTAGFNVKNGPCIGRKSPSTLATLQRNKKVN